VWKYTPTAHKTAHKGYKRTIYFGPQAQEVLSSLLKLDLQAYLFTPADAMAWRNARQREKRDTPMTPSQQRRADAATSRIRKHKVKYDRTTYARAVSRGADRANAWEKCGRVVGNDVVLVPRWHPHQLRHTAATTYRREGDFESAKIILGHRTDSMTQRYAERDSRKAEEIVSKIG
jgi:integrase